MHLIVEARFGDVELLSTVERTRDFLEEAVRATGLTKIMEPYVRHYSGTNPRDWGISGLVMIAESHISIHTFPENSEASIDLFSCKEFDTQSVLKTINEYYGFKEIEFVIIERGLEFRHRGKTEVKLSEVVKYP